MANYPWDGSADKGTHYSKSPDDATFVHLAHTYANAHGSMHASKEFPQGITNGAAWYPLWGGMQVRKLPFTFSNSHPCQDMSTAAWSVTHICPSGNMTAVGAGSGLHSTREAAWRSPRGDTHMLRWMGCSMEQFLAQPLNPAHAELRFLQRSVPRNVGTAVPQPCPPPISVRKGAVKTEEAEGGRRGSHSCMVMPAVAECMPEWTSNHLGMAKGTVRHVKVSSDGLYMQDWSYVGLSCMELTLELSENKWPPESQLPALWADNQPALLALPLMALLGGLRYRPHWGSVSLQSSNRGL